MIKVRQHFAFDLYETGNEIEYSRAQTTVLGLWLIMAYNNPDTSPLWFAGNGVVASREQDGIKFHTPGMGKEILGWDKVETLLKEISDLSYDEHAFYNGIFPKVNSYCSNPNQSRGVYVKDGILASYAHGGITMPIGLRYWTELDVWYGIKATNEDAHAPCEFNNLSTGQI